MSVSDDIGGNSFTAVKQIKHDLHWMTLISKVYSASPKLYSLIWHCVYIKELNVRQEVNVTGSEDQISEVGNGLKTVHMYSKDKI